MEEEIYFRQKWYNYLTEQWEGVQCYHVCAYYQYLYAWVYQGVDNDIPF